ncbi:hypothetical protein HJC23_002695 [Cyclotella cryptica]|uniref:Uncharacterized protein n=1 Tax=Cyclotella cryptica TaxID=29204 RepID=A0ABD3NHY2_9STRA
MSHRVLVAMDAAVSGTHQYTFITFIACGNMSTTVKRNGFVLERGSKYF